MCNYHHNSPLTGLPTSTFGPYDLVSTHQAECPGKASGPPVASWHSEYIDPQSPIRSGPCCSPDLTSFYFPVLVTPFQLPAVSQIHWAHSSLRTSDFRCPLPGKPLPLITCRLVLRARVYTWPRAMPLYPPLIPCSTFIHSTTWNFALVCAEISHSLGLHHTPFSSLCVPWCCACDFFFERRPHC